MIFIFTFCIQFTFSKIELIALRKALGDLAGEGGRIFWVAPSGGRDRPSEETGKFVVAPFDAKVLDMFKIISLKAHKTMHFFPMAMYTHQLIPPPSAVSIYVHCLHSFLIYLYCFILLKCEFVFFKK